jgi:hypothetical protein
MSANVAAVHDMSPTESKRALIAARNYIAHMKEHREEIGGRLATGAMVGAGAAFAAVLDAKLANIPGTSFPMKIAVGLVFAGIGCSEGAGKYSDQVAGLGFGMLGSEAYDITHKALTA